jgi:hypothetical protein
LHIEAILNKASQSHHNPHSVRRAILSSNNNAQRSAMPTKSKRSTSMVAWQRDG